MNIETIQNRVTSKVLGALVVIGLLIGVAANPAAAVTVDTDRPLLSSQELDFGRNWVLGTPLNGGFLEWDVTNGIVTPELEGFLYINNASGTCARMQMAYYDEGHNWIATRSGGTVCATDGSLHSWSVDLAPFGSADVTHVHVRLQVQTGSTYSTVRWQGWFLG